MSQLGVKRPHRLWWRKHRSAEKKLIALALVSEAPLGQFDLFVYQPAPGGIRRMAEETIGCSAEDAQGRADALVRDLLRHECAGCGEWI